MNAVLVVALGGALGSVMRYGTGFLLVQPGVTLLVNVLGSFLIGAGAAYFASGDNPLLRLLLITGILGGFTTFSAFSLESLTLLQQEQWRQALFYIGGNLLGGLLACVLGMWMMSFFVSGRML